MLTILYYFLYILNQGFFLIKNNEFYYIPAVWIMTVYYCSISVMDGKHRDNIRPGCEVDIVLKKDQRSGRLTRGIVKDILTNSSFHPHGIKVRLEDNQVGRVKNIL